MFGPGGKYDSEGFPLVVARAPIGALARMLLEVVNDPDGKKPEFYVIMTEITERVKKTPSLKNDAFMQPVVAALKDVDDVFDSSEVTIALKDVKLPTQTPGKVKHRNNPFAP